MTDRRRATRRVVAVGFLAVVFLAATPGASRIATARETSQEADPFIGSEAESSYELSAENEVPGGFGPTELPDREHSEVTAVDPPCAEAGSEAVLDGETGEVLYLLETCVTYYECGGERVDDIYSGRVAGQDAAGVYAEYLTYIANALAPDVIEALTDEFRNRLSEAILEFELGEPADELALPVFYYCRIGPGGPLEINPVPGIGPSFGWDTTVGDEYDIDGALDGLFDQLRVRLTATPPSMQAIPPLDGAKTFINFPMWFWVDDPMLEDGVWAMSSGETIRIQARAKLERVEWQWGDDTVVCEPDDMKPWTDDLHPYDDRPPCHRIVDELGDYEVTARAVYSVESNISIRPGTAAPFPDTPWIDDGTEISVTETSGPISVREILALNVNEELAFDN